jgi:hypothetical protein
VSGDTKALAEPFLSKPALAVLTLLALGIALEQAPLPELRIFTGRARAAGPDSKASAPSGEAPLPQPKEGEAQLTEASTRLNLATPERATGSQVQSRFGGQAAPLDWSTIETEPPPVPIVDRTGHALDGFFASLERTHTHRPLR